MDALDRNRQAFEGQAKGFSRMGAHDRMPHRRELLLSLGQLLLREHQPRRVGEVEDGVKAVDGRVLHPTGKLTLRTLSHVEHRLNLLSARRSAGPGLRDRAPAPSMRPSAWLLGCTLPGVVEATALNTYPIC